MKSELIEQVMNEEHKMLNWVRSHAGPLPSKGRVKHGDPHSFTDHSVTSFTAAYGHIIQVAKIRININDFLSSSFSHVLI